MQWPLCSRPAPDSESEEDLEWKVLSIVGTKGKEPRRFFKCCGPRQLRQAR